MQGLLFCVVDLLSYIFTFLAYLLCLLTFAWMRVEKGRCVDYRNLDFMMTGSL